jgi:hypothetical protein
MARIKLLKSLALANLLVLSAAPVLADDHTSGTTSKVVFSGIDFADDSIAGYTGIIVSANRDLGKDGILFRLVGVNAQYEYDTTLPGPTPAVIDGDGWFLDAMVGYQFLRTGYRIAGYIGVDYQDHDLTPNDPFNSVNGDEVGFKVVGEFETDDTSRLYLGALASYSTAFDTYWARGRVGLRHEDWIFGVEGGGSGNEGYDVQRIGGFVDMPLAMGPLSGRLTGYAGHQFADDEDSFGLGGGEGLYGGVGYSFSF